jgi:hypothetical protein
MTVLAGAVDKNSHIGSKAVLCNRELVQCLLDLGHTHDAICVNALGRAWEASCRSGLTAEGRNVAFQRLEQLIRNVLGPGIYDPVVLGGQTFAGMPRLQLIDALANIEGRRAFYASLSPAEARTVHESSLTSRGCESSFSTITQDGSGKKPGPTQLIPRLHQFDTVDAIKFMDRDARGFFVPQSKRQWKDPATRTSGWNDGSSRLDSRIRKQWWHDVMTRLRGYVGKVANVRDFNRKYGSTA